MHSLKIRAATGGQSTGNCSDLAVPACKDTTLQLVGQTTLAPVCFTQCAAFTCLWTLENKATVEAYEGSIKGVGQVNKGFLPAWLVQWQEAEDW